MTPDFNPCPAETEGDSDGISIPADPKLLAEGWVRRHLADPVRARESIDLYTSMGYEVKVQTLTSADLRPECGKCASGICHSCVMIYTRKKESRSRASSSIDQQRNTLVHATRCLRDEHRVILSVLACFDIALRQARESGNVSVEVFNPFVEFFRGFADRCHHCKEEDRLFPCMESKGIPREGGPIGVMLEEHRQARLRVRTIADELEAADAGDPVSTHSVLEHGRKLLELLRGHIEKEDHCLFGMADQLIRGADLEGLAEAYRGAENEPDYRATFHRCRDIADRLVERYGVEKV